MTWSFINRDDGKEFRFSLLLGFLLAVLLIPPHADALLPYDLSWRLLVSASMLVALTAVLSKALDGRVVLGMASLAIAAAALTWVPVSSPWAPAAYLISILYLFAIAYFIVRHALDATRVSLNIIFAAVCLYLILGLAFALLFALIHLLDADAFRFAHEELQAVATSGRALPALFSYFSFVTLSTLGYGDISPVSRIAQAWATLESIVGQFYLALVIARLVSLYEGKRFNRNA